MAAVLKIRKVGNSLGVILPQEALAALGVSEGDEVFGIPNQDGMQLTPYDPKFAAALEFAEDYMRRNRDAFRELSKR